MPENLNFWWFVVWKVWDAYVDEKSLNLSKSHIIIPCGWEKMTPNLHHTHEGGGAEVYAGIKSIRKDYNRIVFSL